MNLYDAGYESDQISQILKIEETGFNIIKHINPSVSAEKLRKLRAILTADYKNKEKAVITKFLVEEDKDITSYIKKGITLTCQIRLIEEVKNSEYDETLFIGKGYDYEQMKLLYKYLKKGINVSKYLLAGKNETEIEKIFLIEKSGIKYEDFEEFKTSRQKEAILEAIKEKINPIPFIKPSYSVSQINAIVDAIRKGVDIKKVTKLDLPGSVMNIITKGLLEGYDITPYLDENSQRQYAEVILKAFKEELEVAKIAKYKNHKICKLAMRLNRGKLSMDILDDERYSYEQLSILVTAIEIKQLKPEIDVDKIADPDFTVEQMNCILIVMQHDKKIDDLTVKGVEIGVIRTIAENNLKDIFFDGLIHPAMGIAEINAIAKLKKLGYKISK